MNARRTAAGAGVLVALIASTLALGTAAAQAQPTLDDNSVAVTVVDMLPSTAAYTDKPRPLQISLKLTNTTNQQLYDLSLDVVRDAPVTQQALLEQLIKKPAQTADQNALSPLPGVTIGTLGPHQTTTYTYKTTTSVHTDSGGICLCFQSGGGVYPINFTATAASEQGGITTEVGFGQTYLPAFKDVPKPMQVSWVWPLIDRPHLLPGGTTFADDDLAASVRAGGRLDNALSVLEHVAPKVHLTLVVDPELIEELTIMSHGRYFVESNGKRVAGTGTAAAADWLNRLKTIIAMATSTQVNLTPYADPDIDAVTASGLTWSDTFGQQQQLQLHGFFEGAADTDVTWPADGRISPAALRAVLSQRATSVVVLSDAALPGANHDSPRPDALAPLPAQYGAPGVVAAVTDSHLQSLTGPLLSRTGAGTADLPALVAELAIRAAQDPAQPHYAVISADRYVDTRQDVAVRAILDTASTTWSRSLTLDEAAQSVTPVDHGTLVGPVTQVHLPQRSIAAAQSASAFDRSFSTALRPDDAKTLLAGLPAAIQRTVSSAWQRDPQRASVFADALDAQVNHWRDGVNIVRPSSGTYTLASNDSPLPITVLNTLLVDVKVRVSVTTQNGVAGFRADNSRVVTIPRAASSTSPSRSTLKIQTHVQRAGTFRVNATLLTPDGAQLSENPVPLSVHSTALGAVGVIITAVAGGVLVLALGFRVARRIRARSTATVANSTAPPEPAGVRP